MSKNVSIMEGGKPYNFTVSKIKTGLSSAGEATWVPEDSYRTGVLIADKKWRTYKASEAEGFVGWHRVYINETGQGEAWDKYPALGEHDVSIQESGTQEDYTGVDRIDVAGIDGRVRFVYDGDVVTGTLTKTVDGDTADAYYDAEDEGKNAYTEVFVRGLADGLRAWYVGSAEFQPGGSIYVNSWHVQAIYEDGSGWSAGSEHSGSVLSECTFSPETIPANAGDYVDITITWPRYDDGKMLSTVVQIPIAFAPPAYIRVTTPPTKTVYNEGDTIDFTGIVVTAYKSDDTIWAKSPYTDSNGHIPFADLSFPVTIAHFEDD